MRITVTTDDGEVLDTINIEEEIGDLSKPMPVAELLERLRDCVKDDKLTNGE